jgi:hypothetical protein
MQATAKNTATARIQGTLTAIEGTPEDIQGIIMDKQQQQQGR